MPAAAVSHGVAWCRTADRAFLILTRYSQETNTKVYDVAADLVRDVAGTTPDPGGLGLASLVRLASNCFHGCITSAQANG